MSQDKSWLEELLSKIDDFLSERLKLNLHPDKISIHTIASGVDFLGWIHFPDHRVLRAIAKRRMFKNIKNKQNNVNTVQSYLGLISHGNARRLEEKITDYQTDSGEGEV